MNFKKISAAVLTAALMAGTALTVNAEETHLNLLTARDFSTANMSSLGGGYFLNSNGIFKLGEEELANWRKTDEFKPTSIESNLNLDGLSFWSGDFTVGYVQLVKKDAEGNITERYVVHLDKENNKIKTAYTLDADWSYTTPDGYSMSCTFIESESKVWISVFDPFGNETTTALDRPDDGNLSYGCAASKGGSNVGYLMWQTAMYTDEDKSEDEFDCYTYDYELYIIKKTGELELIRKKDSVYDMNLVVGFPDYVVYGEISESTPVYCCYVYSPKDGKMYPLGIDRKTPDGQYVEFEELSAAPYGTKSIISGYISIDGESNFGYVLADLRENEDAEIISKFYKEMKTEDGEIYLVQTEDDKWGYIDANGKEIAMFDSAGSFIGDYAPVVRDSKAYLIDRDMNKVTEAIDGEGVSTIGDGLYCVTINGEDKLMTYTANPAVSKPSKPADSSNPATGIPGVSAAFVSNSLAAVAITVARKKK